MDSAANSEIPVRGHSASMGTHYRGASVTLSVKWKSPKGISGAAKTRLEKEARRILDQNSDALTLLRGEILEACGVAEDASE